MDYVIPVWCFTRNIKIILCECQRPMRHVGVEMVGGVDGLVLNTPGEDYRGQCLRQLLSEHITVHSIYIVKFKR